MRHTEMEGEIKPACQRHRAKKTSSVPDIPVLLEPDADDRLQLMGGGGGGGWEKMMEAITVIKHCQIHPLMVSCLLACYTLTFDDARRIVNQDQPSIATLAAR